MFKLLSLIVKTRYRARQIYLSWVSVCIFQVLDELRRIIQPSNLKYISEMKDRWEIFYSKVQFYGVMKKVMKPPKTLDGGNATVSWFVYIYALQITLFAMLNGVALSYFSFFKPVEHAAAVFRALPVLFPSSTVPPKKLGICSEAFFHVLKVRLQYSMCIYCWILQLLMFSFYIFYCGVSQIFLKFRSP